MSHEANAPSLERVHAEQQRVGAKFMVLYGLAYLGLFVGLLTPVIVTIARKLSELDGVNLTASLSLVLGTGALFALVGNPLFGKLSDRTTSRFGRRRPWLVGGVAVGLLGLLIVAMAPNVGVLLVGWCLTQLSFNAALAALTAVLPDQVPTSQRGLVSAVLGVGIPLAAITGTLLVTIAPTTLLKFMVPGAFAAVTIVLLAIVLPDKRLPEPPAAPYTAMEFLRSFYLNPRRLPDFSWCWLGRFLLYMGIAFLLTYQVPYLTSHLGVADADVERYVFYGALVQCSALLTVTLLAGYLSDRTGRRKVFVLVAALIFAAGLGVVALALDLPTFLVGIAICGIGQGIYFAVDFAIVADVLPDPSTAARDFGVLNVASAAPQSLAPAIAPVFLVIGATAASGNFTALYLAAAVFAVLGALSVVPIRGVR